MFNNIGSKIKTLAVVICVLGIIASVIGGIYFISIDEDLIVSGVVTIVVGSLVSWLSVFCLYGFGELIENSQLTYETTYKIYKDMHKKDSNKSEPIRPAAPANPYYGAPQNNFNNVPPQNIPMQPHMAPPPYMQPPVAPQMPVEPVQPMAPQPSFEPAPMTPVEPVPPVSPQPSFEPVAPTEPVAPAEPVAPVTPVEPVAPVAPAEPVAPAAPHQPAYRPDVVRDGNLVICPSCGSKNIYGNDMCWRCSLKLME